MKNMSDEELVRKYIISHINCFVKNLPAHHQWCKERDSLKSEILSRLERGRKAIDAMGKAINCRETFLKSEMSVLGDLDMAADNFASSIHKIIEGYQQSCSEQGL